MKILGICGSLREKSANRALLRAARLALSEHEWSEADLFQLPYFDPDNQYSESIPAEVLKLRAQATECDVIFLCSPEYAHGIPGVLKNGLEWMFHEGTTAKPVFTVIGSAQGEYAREQLLEVLKTMDFKTEIKNFLLIKSARTKVDQNGIFTDANAQKDFTHFCEQIPLNQS